MNSDQYVWLLWSSAFLVPWAIVYVAFPLYRRAMLWASLFTMLFGLSEPLFVPEYWMPPSLFDLAENSGFDIESLIFCFGIGGIAAVFYNLLTGRPIKPVTESKRHQPLHRHHGKALAVPFVSFPILLLFPWTPIYSAILALFLGAVAAIFCRPDLKRKSWVGGLLFAISFGMYWSGVYEHFTWRRVGKRDV